MPHLLVDISYHGYGHIAQTAPVLRLNSAAPASDLVAAVLATLQLADQPASPDPSLRYG